MLTDRPAFAAARCYVVKFHANAGPGDDRFAGYVENVATGRRLGFACPDELVAYLVEDLRATDRTGGRHAE